MYHVWRAALGNGATPTAPSNFTLVTRDRPVLVTESAASGTPQRATDWPPFPLHAIDEALRDGWYAYQVSGIDQFGRHSPNSPPGQWFQWTPPPEPRAWYYQDPPGDRVVHPFAVRLLVKTPPPRPSGIEASALDPNDPLVVKDAAYSAWWDELRRAAWYIALSEDERRNLIGLRVRWLWTTAHMRQAPDTREFRIYFELGLLNTLFGRAVSVAASSATESIVETDIANDQPADSYAEGWLRVGTDAFPIVASEAGSPLRLRVRNIGPRDDIRPHPDTPCTLAIPPAFSAGTVSVTNGSPTVTGRGISWSPRLIGTAFSILGEPEEYTVVGVASPTQLTLNRGYARSTGIDRHYALRNPLYVDYGVPASWDQRFFVVGYDQYWTPGEDEEGRPLRLYDAFFPTPPGLARGGLPLRPTLADPIAYGHIGVSAADDKPYTADHPKWAGGAWGGRPGNEGRVGPPATVFRVRRERPPAPQPPPLPGGADHAYATAADYQGHSFYTYRWRPVPHLKTHVLRALDDAVFKVDWSQRPRPPLEASQVQFFPAESTEPRWTSAKRQQVADELNRLNTITGDTAQAMASYRELSNDAQRVLAGLPGNEAAFTQVTIEPLDPDDPANTDRRGPDDPETYTPNPNLRAYLDALDGRSTNRYFYRALSVDAAHNPSALGLAGSPVILRDVVPPRAPLVQLALSGSGVVRLQWLRSEAPDLARYLVYRTGVESDVLDPRRMTLVARVAPSPTSIPAAGEVLPVQVPNQPAWLEYADPATPGQDWLYRIVAEDSASNRSQPSAVLRGRPTIPPPDAPVWGTPRRDATTITLTWSHPSDQMLSSLIERRTATGGYWTSVSGWLPRGVYTYQDRPPDISAAWDYRLRVRDRQGQVASDLPQIHVAAP
jgi:hypothetical protein